MLSNELINSVYWYLRDLDKAVIVQELTKDYQFQLVRSFAAALDVVINRFNLLDLTNNQALLKTLPLASLLKGRLQLRTLPTIAYMRNNPSFYPFFDIGLRDARQLMLNAQEDSDLSDDEKLFSASEKILAVTLDTSPEALILGVFAHLYERTVFQYFADLNLSKDEVLIPLEDIMMLLVVEEKSKDIADIYALMTLAAEVGGLGWIKPERANEFMANYASYELALLAAQSSLEKNS